MRTCRINKRHFSHPNDTHPWLVTYLLHCFLKLACNPKEKWTLYFVHFHSLRQYKSFCILIIFSILHFINLIFKYRNSCSFRYTTQEQNHSKQQPYFDSNCKIENNCKQKSGQQNSHIRFWVLHQGFKRAPFAHVISHNYQHPCQTSHRDVFCKVAQKEHNKQKYYSMNKPGNRRTPTVIYICHGAGNSACSRNTTKNRGHHIGNTLRNQFRI